MTESTLVLNYHFVKRYDDLLVLVDDYVSSNMLCVDWMNFLQVGKVVLNCLDNSEEKWLVGLDNR